jgi:CubicO group peptidase (beta-lactamase class C family)
MQLRNDLRRSALLTLLLWVGCSTLLLAQKHKTPVPVPSQDPAALAEGSFNTFKPTGLSVAIVKDGQVVFAKGFGFANAETKEPAQTNSLYNIASCTKAFTAAAIGLLVEEGKLRWEDKVIDHLPGFQLSDPWVTSELTIKDLLCHRSGLGTFDGDLLWYGTHYTDEQVIAHMRYLPLRQEFRTEFGYQNNLYTTAGLVIQKVTGKTWSQFVTDRLFLPLGMERACASNDELTSTAMVARGHIDGKVIPIYDYAAGKPAASIYASVDELANWVRMWLAGGKWGGKQLLDPKTIRLAQTAQTNINVSPTWESWGVHFRSYGLGWGLFDYAGKKVVEHNGGMPGYISKVCMVPEANLGFVILNNGNDGTVNEALRFKLLDLYLSHVGQDWDKVFKGFADMGNAGQVAETEARLKARVPDTKPSLATAAYAGTYFDKTYGDVKVSKQEDGLHFSMEPTKELFSGRMEHFHYDTWKVQFADPYLPFALISFQIGPKADVEGLKIDLPNGDFHFYQLDFKRKP